MVGDKTLYMYSLHNDCDGERR